MTEILNIVRHQTTDPEGSQIPKKDKYPNDYT